MQLTISAVEGNSQWLDGGSMFGNVPRPLWEKWVDFDQIGRIRLACRALLVETQGARILCETGIGAFFEPKLADRFGVMEREHRLLENLHRLQLSEKDIDFVLLSHLHFDHAGGLLPPYQEIISGGDRLLFPKARYIVGRKAWERAKNPHFRDKASFIPGLVEKLEASQRLAIVEEDQKTHPLLPSCFSFWFSNGHTPGQMHTIVKGDKKTICFAGDLIPGTPWVHLPVTMGYDRFAEKVIDEKLELYSLAQNNDWLFFYTHDPKYMASTIVKTKEGRYEPQNMYAQLEKLSL